MPTGSLAILLFSPPCTICTVFAAFSLLFLLFVPPSFFPCRFYETSCFVLLSQTGECPFLARAGAPQTWSAERPVLLGCQSRVGIKRWAP